MFLQLQDWGQYVLIGTGRTRGEGQHNYPASDECARFVRNWQETNLIGCGVLADFLEEHRDELLNGATGPTDPVAKLDALIASLRNRFQGR